MAHGYRASPVLVVVASFFLAGPLFAASEAPGPEFVSDLLAPAWATIQVLCPAYSY